jgi:hypothetical protein
MVRRRLHPEVKIRSSCHILASVVRLAQAKGAWSRVPDGSRGIRSIFTFIVVVSCQYLPIYGCHHWRWLLLWCLRSLGSYALQQDLLSEVFPGSIDGGVTMTAHLLFVLVSVVIASWFEYVVVYSTVLR